MGSRCMTEEGAQLLENLAQILSRPWVHPEENG